MIRTRAQGRRWAVGLTAVVLLLSGMWALLEVLDADGAPGGPVVLPRTDSLEGRRSEPLGNVLGVDADSRATGLVALVNEIPVEANAPALDQRARFTGRVVDPNGLPVPQATVVLFPDKHNRRLQGIRWHDRGPRLSGLFRTTTDEAGRFELQGRHEPRSKGLVDSTYEFPLLVVLRAGFAIRVHRCNGYLSGSYDAGVIAIEPGCSLAGRVVDEQGVPVAGAKVRVNQSRFEPQHVDVPNDQDDPKGVHRFAPADTAEDGRFLLKGLWKGEVAVHVVAAGFANQYAGRWLTFVGSRKEVGDIVMSRGATISGVIRGPEGDPIPGATVIVTTSRIISRGDRLHEAPDPCLAQLQESRRFHLAGQTVSDAQGHFSASGLDVANFTLYVDAEGYEVWRQVDRAPGPGLVQITLARQATVALSVVEARNGSPVTGASVRAVRRAGTDDPYYDVELPVWSGREARARSGSPGPTGGFFLVERAGTFGTGIEVSAPGYVTHQVTIPGATLPEEVSHEARLTREATVSGQVTDGAGAPVPHATMTLRPPESLPVRPEPRATSTDKKGRYILHGVPGGDWTIAAIAPRFLETSRAIAVQAEQALEHVDLVLGRGGAIVGRVLKAGGSPSVGYGLRLFQNLNLGDETNRSLQTRTDEQGHYGFCDLPAGTWRLQREPREVALLPLGPDAVGRFLGGMSQGAKRSV